MGGAQEHEHERGRSRSFLLAVVVTFLSLTSCSDDGDASDAAAQVTAPSAQQSEVDAAEGDAILIRTAVRATEQSGRGVVLRGSLLGEEEFCPGGTFSDRIARPEVGMVKTLRCDDGALEIGFNPDPSTRVQNSEWRVLGGTDRYAEMRGQGWMVVAFDTGDPSKGRETYTGVVTSGE